MEIDDRVIQRKYGEYIDMLSNHEEHSHNVKYFQIRDERGELQRPTLFIQLILGLIIENEESVKIKPTLKHDWVPKNTGIKI